LTVFLNNKENQKMQNSRLRIFLGCLAITILLLFRHGYTFGSGDQSEMLPYAKYLTDKQLYASDFYIQSIAASVPNERYIFSSCLSLFGDKMDWAAFILHFVATMFMVLGLFRLAVKGMSTEGGQWLATLLPVMVLYGTNLGGNELYYNYLVPSYVAQVFGLWVFVALINNKALVPFVFLMLMTYIHPLIGIQLWLLISLTYFSMYFVGVKGIHLRSLLILNGLYLSAVGFFLFRIKTGYDDGGVNAQQFFDIIAFRAPHHYFPHTFPVQNWLILALPFFIGWKASNSIVWFVFRWIAIGMVVYLVGIYILKSPTPLSTQWFSTTVWVKVFSFFITFSLIERMLQKGDFFNKVLSSKTLVINGLMAISLLSIVLMTPSFRLFKQKNYDFPFLKTDTPEVTISKLAKEKTPVDALFLIPSDLSEFRFWSERSSYIDYKATNHRQSAFVEWYDRIQKVYKISLADRQNGVDLTVLGNHHFRQLTEADFLQFAKNQHITHVLIYKNVVLNFEKIAENEQYVIYNLQLLK
jgi:hypothetical protein